MTKDLLRFLPQTIALLVVVLTSSCSQLLEVPKTNGPVKDGLAALQTNQAGGRLSTAPANLSVDIRPGSIRSWKWRGAPISVGGDYYAILSCSGVDDRETNADSKAGVGHMLTPDGSIPTCGRVNYSMSFVQQQDTVLSTMRLGPFAAETAILSLGLDIDKLHAKTFSWESDNVSWQEGCSEDWQTVLPAAPFQFLISAIRAPCIIRSGEDILGAVGLAKREARAGRAAIFHGPMTKIKRVIERLVVRNAWGNPIDLTPHQPRLVVTNHPGTHDIAVELSGMKAGYTVELAERVVFSDPSVRARPCGGLPVGEALTRGEFVDSCNDRYRLWHQFDGNLVLYRKSDNYPLWVFQSPGGMSDLLIMQGDGNLVLYAPGSLARFHTGTYGNPGSRLALQDDGNAVVYSPTGVALWQSGTYGR